MPVGGRVDLPKDSVGRSGLDKPSWCQTNASYCRIIISELKLQNFVACDLFNTGNVLVHNYVRSASAGSTSKQCNRAAVSLWDGNHRHFISGMSVTDHIRGNPWL